MRSSSCKRTLLVEASRFWIRKSLLASDQSEGAEVQGDNILHLSCRKYGLFSTKHSFTLLYCTTSISTLWWAYVAQAWVEKHRVIYYSHTDARDRLHLTVTDPETRLHTVSNTHSRIESVLALQIPQHVLSRTTAFYGSDSNT